MYPVDLLAWGVTFLGAGTLIVDFLYLNQQKQIKELRKEIEELKYMKGE